MKILIVMGTRPEAIKFAPVIEQLKNSEGFFDVSVCSTGQHRQMLYQVLEFFGIQPDFELDVMSQNQGLFDLTARLLMALEGVIDRSKPDLVFVQGDTTTALAGALSGFYRRKPVAHLEAGLRSFNKFSPFPEEMNRVLISRLADFHFAPTQRAVENLQRENVAGRVYLVGNTVIDALFLGLKRIDESWDLKRKIEGYFYGEVGIKKNSRIILVTAHRRESFGEPFRNICGAIVDIATHFPDVEIVYPVHLNPNVRKPVFDILGGVENVHLIEPLDYPSLIWLMRTSYLVLTDSGGIQEEAPSLGKPVLVMRDVTERIEGIDAGTARLVGTDRNGIVTAVGRLLEDEVEYSRMATSINPYGDGKAASRIAEILKATT